jgi:hypothetical protein
MFHGFCADSGAFASIAHVSLKLRPVTFVMDCVCVIFGLKMSERWIS